MSLDYPCVYQDNGKCKKFSGENITSWCVWGPCDDQTPSNADRIRSMSDEELARLYVVGYAEGWDTPEDALKWLQRPAEEGD